MVETCGERKADIGMNHKGQWGYHPLIMTLANTREVLYVVNRSGNRPSHENAAVYFDRAIDLCRRGGFRQVRLRGDTDFSQTTHLDRWHEDGVEFVFGLDAMPNLVQIAENLPDSAWKELRRNKRRVNKSGQTHARRPNYKEQFVVKKGYTNKRLEQEFVAEFDYQPTACQYTYRMVVLRKQVSVLQGQQNTSVLNTPAASRLTRFDCGKGCGAGTKNCSTTRRTSFISPTCRSRTRRRAKWWANRTSAATRRTSSRSSKTWARWRFR